MKLDKEKIKSRDETILRKKLYYSPLLKIFITYYNFTGVLFIITNFDISNQIYQIVKSFLSFTGPFDRILKYLYCFVSFGSLTKLDVDFMGNFFITFGFIFGYLIIYYFSPSHKNNYLDYVFGTSIVLYNYLYIKMNYFLFQIISPICIYSSQEISVLANRYDTTIEYWTNDKTIIVLSVIVIILLDFVFPITWIYFLRKAHNNQLMYSDQNIIRYSYLYLGYHEKAYFFEAVNLNIVKFIFVLLMVFSTNSSNMALSLMGLMFWIYGRIIYEIKPYVRRLNDLARLSCSVYTITIFFGLIYTNLESIAYKYTHQYFEAYTLMKLLSFIVISGVFLVNLYFMIKFIIFACSLVKEDFDKMRAEKKKKKNKDKKAKDPETVTGDTPRISMVVMSSLEEEKSENLSETFLQTKLIFKGEKQQQI